MRKTLIALVVVLIVAGAAHALDSWFNNKQYLDTSRDVQQGYAAGVYDAIASLADAGWTAEQMRRTVTCLNARGDRLGQLVDWTLIVARENVSAGKNFVQASTILAKACP